VENHIEFFASAVTDCSETPDAHKSQSGSHLIVIIGPKARAAADVAVAVAVADVAAGGGHLLTQGANCKPDCLHTGNRSANATATRSRKKPARR